MTALIQAFYLDFHSDWFNSSEVVLTSEITLWELQFWRIHYNHLGALKPTLSAPCPGDWNSFRVRIRDGHCSSLSLFLVSQMRIWLEKQSGVGRKVKFLWFLGDLHTLLFLCRSSSCRSFHGWIFTQDSDQMSLPQVVLPWWPQSKHLYVHHSALLIFISD